MEKVLDGDLSRFEVPDLLTFLGSARRTGVLVLERKDQETKLFLRDGKPVFANSTRDDLRFGGALLRMGRLAEGALARALERRERTPRRLGQVLLAEGLLTENELASLLKVQVSEVIFDTFAWKDGAFAFWDRVPPPPNLVHLEMDLQSLLMEGVRRLDVRSKLAEVFPDQDMAVEAQANPDRVKQSVTLTPEEWKVFFLADGRRSLREICALVEAADPLGTLQILWNLVRARLLRVVPAPPLPPPAHAEPAPADQSGKRRKSGEVRASQSRVEPGPVARPQKLEDDTREIVTPKAVQYPADAKAVTVSRLVLLEGGRETTSFPLARETCTLGRHKNNDIVITDPKVSSFHARIDRTPDGFVLVDLKSRNGSYVNGQRVETARLRTGDEVRMGAARLLYRVDYSAS
jgi:pSer/pThr/pTyr-binding forkhead associated (FHA) protein